MAWQRTLLVHVSSIDMQPTVLCCCRPPRTLPGTPRVVYLYGEPLLAVASHYRRGHAHHQVSSSGLGWGWRAEMAALLYTSS